MSLDLMSIAEGASPGAKPKRQSWGGGTPGPSWGGGTPGSSAKTPAAPATKSKAPATPEDTMAALRKLEELQVQHSSSSLHPPKAAPPKPKPDPTDGAAPYDLPHTGPAADFSVGSLSVAKKEPTPPPANDWTCRTCSSAHQETLGDCTVPGGFRFCPTCGDSFTGTSSKHTPPPEVTDEWECWCGEFCPTSFTFCVECGFPAGAPKPPPDDECGGCGEALGDSFAFCPDCGTTKGMWNDKAVKGDPSQAGADDWACANCKDGMPADFSYCIICGLARPPAA